MITRPISLNHRYCETIAFCLARVSELFVFLILRTYNFALRTYFRVIHNLQTKKRPPLRSFGTVMWPFNDIIGPLAENFLESPPDCNHNMPQVGGEFFHIT